MEPRNSYQEQQNLIDICFEIAMLMHDKQYREIFNNMNREELAEWVAKQLRECGFPTRPCGLSWGRLYHERSE